MAHFYDLMKSLKLGDESTEVLTLYDYVVVMGDMNFRVDCKKTGLYLFY